MKPFIALVTLIAIGWFTFHTTPEIKSARKMELSRIETAQTPETVKDTPIKQIAAVAPVEAPKPPEPKPAPPPPAPAPVAAAPASNCDAWIAGAGVPDPGSARILIGKESACQPGRLNPSSYACGIAQSLPCTKMYPHATKAWIAANKYQTPDGRWFIPNGDGAHELRWMNSYTLRRYGSWAAAVQFHHANNWY